jgi:hypothetical protein
MRSNPLNHRLLCLFQEAPAYFVRGKSELKLSKHLIAQIYSNHSDGLYCSNGAPDWMVRMSGISTGERLFAILVQGWKACG